MAQTHEGVNLHAPGVTLRPYQIDGIERVRAQIRAGKRALLLVLPTGGGKTIVAGSVVHSAYTRGKRVVFFAHARELILNTRAKLIEAGVPAAAIGILMADDTDNLDAPIIVASIQTWRAREKSREDMADLVVLADLVFIDEAHRSCGDTYLRALRKYLAGGATALGLTATPFRSDGRGLGDIYESLDVVAYPSQLIADGFLCAPKVYSLPPEKQPNLAGVGVSNGDYARGELERTMDTPTLVGDIVEQWRRLAGGRRTVVFAAGISHSQHIAQSFVDAGIAAEHLDGETPKAERDAILARLKSGETTVVTNCDVLVEGWDCPAVKCCILARPTKSTGRYLQMAGRILRPWNDVEAIIIDHAGSCLVHGLPQDDREFTLEMTRPKSERDGEPPCKVCPSCHAVIAAGSSTCPECGHDFPAREMPKVERGELVEFKASPKRTQDQFLRESFDAIVREWLAENHQRIAAGKPPLWRSWVGKRFYQLHGRKPPIGCVAPPDLHATPAEKREAWKRLNQIAAERHYDRNWPRKKFLESYGHQPERT